jgi:hypothetical protein
LDGFRPALFLNSRNPSTAKFIDPLPFSVANPAIEVDREIFSKPNRILRNRRTTMAREKELELEKQGIASPSDPDELTDADFEKVVGGAAGGYECNDSYCTNPCNKCG